MSENGVDNLFPVVKNAIDTSNLLASNVASYTATQDCWVGYSSWDAVVLVDGEKVYGDTAKGDAYDVIFLKKGQTISGMWYSGKTSRVWGVK